jgi:nucleotide-binding universal stress UspA family protein
MPPISMETAFGNYHDDFMKAADACIVELKKAGMREGTTHHFGGPVPDAIRGQALLAGTDLIVTGRGVSYRSVSRMWSHLYPIIRQAPCPVLSI